MRSRFAEDSARRAIDAGVRQILVLGAGLDTFAYRLEPRENLRVFELDHPATQRDKRARLADAGIDEPSHLAFVAHDFEQGDMRRALAAAGLDVASRTFVLWLGVTPYLTEDAVFVTLSALAGLPGGVEIVFDYANPSHAIEDKQARASMTRWLRRWPSRASRSAAPSTPISLARAGAGARLLPTSRISTAPRSSSASCPRSPPKPRPGPGGHVVRMATR